MAMIVETIYYAIVESQSQTKASYLVFLFGDHFSLP